ncbi:type VI secretion system-associated protein TagF [Marinomonas ostreistagni]|uniref:Type VI secretion system-associated protein TagF n=1 Tax=Marinomonas ostreistagni TaxID=359209 RepID=A0ABS0Z7X4_9GAMM|nr:type VI secretion system-associated protein TagF [Marinomonas ostreistagni]MBJ7549765.1 type VI secretion system-associated protein TagF [Marinomonas ostreistagni]
MSGLTIGIYGKLPAHSDFISDSIHSEVSNELYEWGQTSLYHSQQQLSEMDWLSAYLVSPIWRMCVPPTDKRKHAWIGIMVPSVDAVGRYFPLFLVFEIESKHICVEWLFKEADALFSMLEKVSLEALQKRLPLNDVKQQLAEALVSFELGDDLQVPAGLVNGESLSLKQLTSEELMAFLPTPLNNIQGSLWWSFGDVHGRKDPFVMAKNLPNVEDYLFLLTGNAMQKTSLEPLKQN